MKKLILSALLLLSSLGSSQAANLYASNLGNGISLINGTTAIANGTVRFGVFPDDFDFQASGGKFDELSAAFTEVYSFSGPLSVADTAGFFQITHSYDASAIYGGVPYSTGIAGRNVYVWILDNVTPADAVQLAVFATDQTWAAADALVPDTFVSPDTGAAGLVAYLGTTADGSDIGAGAPSHRASAALNAVIASRTPATPNIEIGSSVTFSVSVEGGFNNIFQWRKNGEDIPLATESTFTIPSVALADYDDYDVVVTSEGVSITSNVVKLAPALPVIRQQPISQIVAVGDAINLSVDAVGAGNVRLQWKKGGDLPGATTPVIQIPNATLANAGPYTVIVDNGPGVGTGKVTSQIAQVAVVDTTNSVIPVVLNGAAKLAVKAVGVGLTYQWKLGGVNVLGATKPVLSVKVDAEAKAGDYVCAVTSSAAGTLDSGVQKVVIVGEAPEFVGGPTLSLPNGQVGGNYFYDLVAEGAINTAVEKTPLGFSMKGQPKGLAINSKGQITGRPAAPTNGAVTFEITAIGPNRAAIKVNATITILGYPGTVNGTYVGSIERDDAVNQGLGGRIDFTVTSTGALTGKLLMGTAAVLPFKGFLNVPVGAGPAEATIIIRQKTYYVPLVLTFKIDGSNLVDATISQDAESAAIQGWKNNGGLDAKRGGLHTFALIIDEADEGEPTIPQGAGHGTITVKAPAGTATFAGRTADGEKITGATFVGPNGQLVVFNTYYKPFKGSLHGVMELNTPNADAVENDTITGLVTWNRPAITSPKTRLYQAGFGPINLTPMGGRYRAPATEIILDVAAESQADLEFEEAGINPEANDPSVDVTLQARNKVQIPDNPERTVLKVNALKGTITGSIVQPTNRKANFLGLAVRRDPASIVGLGYFILPQAPTEGQTPATAPFESGIMMLHPTPPAP